MAVAKYNNFNINNIELERDSHIYTLNDDKSINFSSVTTFISEFFEKFDPLKTATKLVNTVPKYSHLTIEELLSEWKYARDHGTKVHNQIEDNLIEGEDVDEPKSDFSIKSGSEFSKQVVFICEVGCQGEFTGDDDDEEIMCPHCGIMGKSPLE